jgi:transposase
LLDARRNRKSEQLSMDQLALFAAAWQERQAQTVGADTTAHDDEDKPDAAPGGDQETHKKTGRQPLPRNLKRERIVHNLAEAKRHCQVCRQDLRPIGEETSERYEYIPAQLMVLEDVCKKYACDCTVKTAAKPPQPIEKSTAGASLLAQVIVGKMVDHLPLNRQEKIFERHGVDISRKTMGGWVEQCADLLNPLDRSMKEVLFQSKVIGTDDTGVKVLDKKLPFARTGRIWVLRRQRLSIDPVRLHTDTGAGWAGTVSGGLSWILAGRRLWRIRRLLKDPARGLIEVGCWAHARRYCYKALESDQPHMGSALLLIGQL